MIKQLLLGSLLLASPQPYKAITNPVYIETEYNKQIETQYIATAGPSSTPVVTFSNYAFNTQDDRQKIYGTIDTKTTNIHTTTFNSTGYYVTTKAISITEINSNNYQYTSDITAQQNMPNIPMENLQEFYIVWHAIVYNNSNTTTNMQEAYTNSQVRYTNASSIASQIDYIYNRMNWSEIYGDSYYSLNKSNTTTDNFYRTLNESLTYLKQHFTLDYITSGTPQQIKTVFYRYIYLKYNLSTNYNDLTETTKNTYINLLQGYNSKLVYQTTYNSNIEVHTDVIDIPGLIFTILGMPFAWISTAFNLTLFTGTPYAINVANVLLGVIGVLIAIFIIRKLLK